MCSEWDGEDIKYPIREYDDRSNLIFNQWNKNQWIKYEYDINNNRIYELWYDGGWSKYEYNELNQNIFFINSNGVWIKYRYDSNGRGIYKEQSDGTGFVCEYDNLGNRLWSMDLEQRNQIHIRNNIIVSLLSDIILIIINLYNLLYCIMYFIICWKGS